MSPLPWYDVTGPPAGPPVVLLHAFPLSSTVFDRLRRHLDGSRVVRVDLPGLGRSAPAAVGEPSVAAMADAVVAVLDAEGVERAVVLGVSTGGYVALELAARHPDRVSGLVLGSTTTRVIEPDVPAQRRALADELDATGDLDALVKGADAGLGRTALREQPTLLPLLQEVVAASDPVGVAWVARAVAGRRDTTADLAAYDGPVLLLFGDEDTETPPVRAAEMAAARGARATRTVVLARTGHLTVLERPLQAAAALLDMVG
ncbi:alpha/beta fold hydrolase [Nocardioides rubriscoriae]|uniref:alpha/beta fold hydrolase n=1 Tax=Nocardioides rubriscoriae TaxID=642762 RepID=UPI0011DF0234|nr:alpha/beta hydrolase [Nocardioides rubriscoriae]